MLENDPSLTNNPNLGEWNNWAPLWNDKKISPHDLQEKHSPTTKTKKSNTSKETRSRILDERLWDSLSSEQQDAAHEIVASFQSLTNGIGYTTVDLNRIPGSGYNISELHAELINIYISWGQNCYKEDISHAMILDILCFGHSCSHVDRERRMRKGTAKKNLLQGLTLYCNMRGWRY